MSFSPLSVGELKATIHEVLPKSGLAYAVDELGRSWTITRSAASEVFDRLTPGESCRVSIQDLGDATVVSACSL